MVPAPAGKASLGSHLTAFYVRVIQVSGRYYQPRTISLCIHLTCSFANDHALFSLSSWWLLRFGQHLPQPDILPQRGRSAGPAPQWAWKTLCLPSRGLRCHRGKKQGTKNRPSAWGKTFALFSIGGDTDQRGQAVPWGLR